MKSWIWAAALLLGVAHAWERPGNESTAVTVTTIVDILSMNNNTGALGDVEPAGAAQGYQYWVAFADADVGTVCAQLANVSPELVDPVQRARQSGTLNNRYVLLDLLSPPNPLPAIHLPVALFARAHNQTVRVKIRFVNGHCRVAWLQTCAAADNCEPFAP